MKERQENKGTQEKENKALLFAGLGLSAAAFVTVLVPLLLFFIPGGADGSSPLLKTGIYVNAFGAAAALTGVILTALAKPRSGVARLNLFFSATAFLLGVACFLLCLVFAAIIPLHAIG